MTRTAGFAVFVMLVVAAGCGSGERGGATKAFVDSLNAACENYRAAHGTYPPALPYSGSQNLHFYLGREAEGRKPFFEFRLNQLMGGPESPRPEPPAVLIDAFGGAIQYLNPGVVNPRGVDIWSMGPDGVTDENPKSGDDIGNWRHE